MAFEVISYALGAPPNRIYTMLKLIETLQQQSPTREVIFSLLQPDSIQESKDSAERAYGILQNLNLISVSQNTDEVIRVVDTSFLESFELFRLKMQQNLLGAKQQEDDNFLLSQLTAWYAIYNQEAYLMRRESIERRFHEDLYPSVIANNSTRKINDTILLSWGLWARFLGFGREYSLAGGQRKLVPNAYIRVYPLLNDIFHKDVEELPINQFLEKLSTFCPELDGGIVYNRIYESVYNQSAINTPLSLMLSSALRTLQTKGVIELINRADALNTRQLFPSQSYIGSVSHIRLNRENKTI